MTSEEFRLKLLLLGLSRHLPDDDYERYTSDDGQIEVLISTASTHCWGWFRQKGINLEKYSPLSRPRFIEMIEYLKDNL